MRLRIKEMERVFDRHGMCNCSCMQQRDRFGTTGLPFLGPQNKAETTENLAACPLCSTMNERESKRRTCSDSFMVIASLKGGVLSDIVTGV